MHQEINNEFEDDATYRAPLKEFRRPPPRQRPDEDADGETYETVENPHRQKQLDTGAPGSTLDGLGGFQQEVYADVLGEQKLYGKGFDAERSGGRHRGNLPRANGGRVSDQPRGSRATSASPALCHL